MNFQVVCEPTEFLEYQIELDSDVTFCLREFKILLGLADLLNLPMTILFDHPGRPIIFSFDADEFHFQGIFVLATISNQENEQSANGSAPSIHDVSTMGEEDLVSYRQFTMNSNRAAKKRPAPSPSPSPQRPQRKSPNEKRQVDSRVEDTTFTVLSQQSLIGLQLSEDNFVDLTEDEDQEEN